MKIGDIVKYKQRYKETVGLIINIVRGGIVVLWGAGNLVLVELQTDLEVINEN